MISDELKLMLAEILENYLISSEPDLLEIKKIAIELEAIPVYADIGGCLLINLVGDIVCYEWDNDNPKIETNPRWRNIALREAILKYPILETLKEPTNQE